MNIYQSFLENKSLGKKSLAVLVDPDKTTTNDAIALCELAKSTADYFFVGSSLLLNDNLKSCVSTLKKHSNIPVILFPGNTMQVCAEADAILFLSLISGRNAEFLIGQHVIAAPLLKGSAIEIIPTGYILIDSGHATSVNYMSQTLPIPNDKNDIAISTALAGEMLGMKVIFMDAGSGGRLPVSTSMIEAVKQNIAVPLIVGGGIRTPEKAIQNCLAGADVVVIGNAIERDRNLITEMADAINSFQTS